MEGPSKPGTINGCHSPPEKWRTPNCGPTPSIVAQTDPEEPLARSIISILILPCRPTSSKQVAAEPGRQRHRTSPPNQKCPSESCVNPKANWGGSPSFAP